MFPEPSNGNSRKALLEAMRDITGRGLFNADEVSQACEAVDILAHNAVLHALETGGEITPIAAIDGVGMGMKATTDPVGLAEDFLNTEAGTLADKARTGYLNYRTQVPAHDRLTQEATVTALTEKIAREIVSACSEAACLVARSQCSFNTLEITDAPYVIEWGIGTDHQPMTNGFRDMIGYIVDIPIEATIQDQRQSVRGILRALVPLKKRDELGQARIDDLDLFVCDRRGHHCHVSNTDSGPARLLLRQLQKFDPVAPELRQRLLAAAEDAVRWHHERRHWQNDDTANLGPFSL